MKRIVKDLLSRAGYAIVGTRDRYMQDGLFTVHHARFQSDSRFRDAYRRGVAASGGWDPAFEWRVHVALWAASVAMRADGDFVECGVNAGFISSAILRRVEWNGDRRFYLIDTFAGPVMGQYSEGEIARGRVEIARRAMASGSYVTDVDRVRRNFAEWPYAVVIQGEVPEVLARAPADRVAFLHIDLNCAAPERAALDHFWDRLSPGAVVLLDDYAYFGHEEQAESADAFAKLHGADVLCLPTGQGLIFPNVR